MGKKLEHPKSHIVSCRINNNEMEILKKAARQSSLSVSEFLRSCLEQPLTNWSRNDQKMATDLRS